MMRGCWGRVAGECKAGCSSNGKEIEEDYWVV